MVNTPLKIKWENFGFLLLFLIITLFNTNTPVALAKEVVIGVYNNHPKVFIDQDEKPQGIFVDIIEDIAKRENWDLRYVHGTWSQSLERLETGKIDLMLDVAYSKTRTMKFDFSENDAISNWAQVYTRKGFNIKLFTDLKQMRVAAMKKGIHVERFKQLVEGFGFHLDLVIVGSYEEIFKLIHEDKVDAGIINRIYGHMNEDKYRVTRSPVVFSPASLRFAVKKGHNTDLITSIDRHLSQFKKEKTSVYHQSLRQWLGETTKLKLPSWIAWILSVAAVGICSLIGLTLIFRHQVNKKTSSLRLANTQLESQVNETMKAHLELKRSNELLIRHERLSALGQLASGIAHDFNNMLTPILGYSDLILEDPDLLKNRPKALSKIKIIHTSANTSRETVKRLQQIFNAKTKPSIFKVNLAKVVSDVVEATKPLWKNQNEAHSNPITMIQVVPEDLEVTVDRAQLSEALMNLVLNALHAIPSKGTITIRAWPEDTSFTLQVIDTGCGMPKRVAQRCLEPFYSTKGEEGTGMGLAMVYGYVNRHGGTLHIDSTPDEGTTISMRIPMVDHEMPNSPFTGAALPFHPSLNVLIVDDDENCRKLLQAYLKLDDHIVSPVADVVEAVSVFKREAYDLVITDRAMPKISGDQLAQHVKNSEKKVPVLMVTGFAEIMASKQELPEGVDLLMGKPFTVQELRTAIQQCLKPNYRK